MQSARKSASRREPWSFARDRTRCGLPPSLPRPSCLLKAYSNFLGVDRLCSRAMLELPEGQSLSTCCVSLDNLFLESRMNAAHIQPTFRGVSCRFCQKPIRLSASFIQREITIKQAGSGLGQELCSRVFAMRCRACQGEAIYALGHIVDFSQSSGEPPSWVRHLDRIADSGSRSE